MKTPATLLLCSVLAAIGLSARDARAAAPDKTVSKEVSGTLTVDGKTVALEHAYMDVSDPDEPIVFLCDKALPAEAVPFVPEKLVKEKQLYAVAFSVSGKDGKLTNTYGKVHAPGHEIGVGLGRVEEGRLKLTVSRLDASHIDGTVSTVKPVGLSYITYSFDLKFRATARGPKS